jgi:uncharacterized protein YndB with AHSA1/START domain
MTKANQKELAITRIFNAPRDLVWKAWTQPEYLVHWWGPKGFTSPVSKIDLRVGCVYLNCMRSPQGQDFWSTGVFREIVVPERLVMTDSFADESGKAVPASHYGLGEDFPFVMLIAAMFEEEDGKTKLTLNHSGIDGSISATDRDNMQQGWNESFDKLDAYLASGDIITSGKKNAAIFVYPSDREIVMTRIFDAPRDLVFKAQTDPNLIPQWWGPRSLTTTVDKMDVRPGGVWRFVQRGADGNEYAFNGVYREIVPPQRIVDTFEFEGMPGHVMLETGTLEEQGGKTKLTVTALFQTAEDRDGSLKSGMLEGWSETLDRLAELLEKVKSS